jgi:hypothetical protein
MPHPAGFAGDLEIDALAIKNGLLALESYIEDNCKFTKSGTVARTRVSMQPSTERQQSLPSAGRLASFRLLKERTVPE